MPVLKEVIWGFASYARRLGRYDYMCPNGLAATGHGETVFTCPKTRFPSVDTRSLPTKKKVEVFQRS